MLMEQAFVSIVFAVKKNLNIMFDPTQRPLSIILVTMILQSIIMNPALAIDWSSDVLINRCKTYLLCKQGQAASWRECCGQLSETQVQDYCDELWQKADALCNQTDGMEDFVKGFQDFHLLPKDKTMLWSGSGDLAQYISRMSESFIVMENTLLGYIMNNITWCSNQGEAFWRHMSYQFSHNSNGIVTVLLNASREPIYKSDTFFGRVEVQELKPEFGITGVLILIVDNKMDAESQSCKCHDDASIDQLRTILRQNQLLDPSIGCTQIYSNDLNNLDICQLQKYSVDECSHSIPSHVSCSIVEGVDYSNMIIILVLIGALACCLIIRCRKCKCKMCVVNFEGRRASTCSRVYLEERTEEVTDMDIV